MRFKFWWGILVCLVVIGSAQAETRAVIADDSDIAVLKQIIDIAVRAQGNAVVPAAAYWLDKLNKAPAATEHKDTPPEPQKEPSP